VLYAKYVVTSRECDAKRDIYLNHWRCFSFWNKEELRTSILNAFVFTDACVHDFCHVRWDYVRLCCDMLVCYGRFRLGYVSLGYKECPRRKGHWEVIVSVILNKKLYTHMCPIRNGFRDRPILLYSTLYTVQRSNTPCPHARCKYIDVDGGIFENVLYWVNCTNFVAWTVNTAIRNST
jgi:hypothetical protein